MEYFEANIYIQIHNQEQEEANNNASGGLDPLALLQ
jgi:hypothetical protein